MRITSGSSRSTIMRRPASRPLATSLNSTARNRRVSGNRVIRIMTEATMRITRLPETRLFRAVLFKDVASGLEAGRRMMVDRLDPLVIRMYDPHSTGLLVKKVLGYELSGA